MEYCANGNVETYINAIQEENEALIDEAQLKAIFGQMACSLFVLDQQNFLHLDIKP
jgi:serine/threonine protein kinase